MKEGADIERRSKYLKEEQILKVGADIERRNRY
jgi:hypothetical protein